MSKGVTGPRPCEVATRSALATIQTPLPLASVLRDAKQGPLDLVVSTGPQVFEAMLEQDREALCGPKWKRVPDRAATRAGQTRGEVTLGGRRIVLPRPRVRSATAGELRLPSFAFAAGRDPLDARTLRSTNPIENLNGLLGRFTRNVKHGRDGSMIVRWIAARIFEAQRRFRRIRGHRDLETLCSAIERHAKKEGLDREMRVA